MPIRFVNFSKEDFLGEKNVVSKIIPWHFAQNVMSGEPLQLCFNSPDVWQDKWDSMFYSLSYSDEEDEYPFPLHKRVKCCCFTSGSVCEAQWKMYPAVGCVSHDENKEGDDKSIQVFLRNKELLHLLEQTYADKYEVYVAKVTYHKTSELRKSINQMDFLDDKDIFNCRASQVRLLTVKRNAFAYENEIRVILVSKKPFDEANPDVSPLLLIIPNPATLIESVVFSPSFPKTEYERIRGTFASNLGKGIKSVGRSNLYENAPRKKFIRLYSC